MPETFLWLPSIKIVQAIIIRLKHGRQGGGGGGGGGGAVGVQGLFSLFIYLKKFTSLLVRNHWTYFSISEILDHHVSLDQKIYTKT